MILTENEQSLEGVWAQGQTAQRTRKKCEEWLFSPEGLCSSFPIWKGMQASEILRQRTIDPLLPGFQLLKADVK